MFSNLFAIWPVITSLVTVVAISSVYGEKIRALEVKQDKFETIKEDVVEIKITVGRIEERLEHITNKRNNK